jgi:hypothetical protein
MIPIGVIQQRIDQFDVQHGNDGIQIGVWLVFSDGAQREWQQPGRMLEPPSDPAHLSEIKIRYLHAKLNQESQELQELRMRSFETPQMRVDRFDQRHGRDGLVINRQVVYSDGARRDVLTLGAMEEPPSDPYELAKIQVAYHEELVRRASAQFKEWKRELECRAEEALRYANAKTPPPAPNEADLSKLKNLQNTVQEHRRRLQKIRSILDRSRPAEVQAREQRASAVRESTADMLASVQEVRI